MYSFQPLLILSDIFHDTVLGELSEITSSICVTVTAPVLITNNITINFYETVNDRTFHEVLN